MSFGKKTFKEAKQHGKKPNDGDDAVRIVDTRGSRDNMPCSSPKKFTSVRLKEKKKRPAIFRSISFRSKSCEEIDLSSCINEEETHHQPNTKTPPPRPKPYQPGFAAISEHQGSHSAPATPATALKKPKSPPKYVPPLKLNITKQPGSTRIKQPPPDRPPPRSPIVKQPSSHMFDSAYELQKMFAAGGSKQTDHKTVSTIEPYAVFIGTPQGSIDEDEYVDMTSPQNSKLRLSSDTDLYMEMDGPRDVVVGINGSSVADDNDGYTKITIQRPPDPVYETVPPTTQRQYHHGNWLPAADTSTPSDLPQASGFNQSSDTLSSHTADQSGNHIYQNLVPRNSPRLYHK